MTSRSIVRNDYELIPLTPSEASRLQEITDEFIAQFITEILPDIKRASYLAAHVEQYPELYPPQTKIAATAATEAGIASAKLIKGLVTGRLSFIALQPPGEREGEFRLAVVDTSILGPSNLGAIMLPFMKPILAAPWKMILKSAIWTAIAAGLIKIGDAIADAWKLDNEAEKLQKEIELEAAKACGALPPADRKRCLDDLQRKIKADADTPIDEYIRRGGRAIGTGAAGALEPIFPLILLFLFAREKFKK